MMSQELINNLRRTKLDAIIGHYSGGNDEGGIETIEAIILKRDSLPTTGLILQGFTSIRWHYIMNKLEKYPWTSPCMAITRTVTG